MEIAFIIIVCLLFNAFFLYPVILSIFSFFKGCGETIKVNELPRVSILLSAYNEENVISSRIENIASLNYDFSKIELIIGSDNSTDRTNEIIENYLQKYEWLKISKYDYRSGKAGVLNKLIKLASNDIIVFTDANTVFEVDALHKLVALFNDPSVGGVCGHLILEDSKTLQNKEERKYWLYENVIKKLEGRVGTLIGANGGIFAIRKELFSPIPTDKAVTDDLYISLKVLSAGYKFRYAADAQAYEDVAFDLQSEFSRKKRFAATNYQTLFATKELVFNKNLLITYCYWSHKIIRWFMPLFLVLLFLFNINLFGKHDFYDFLLYVQLIIYSVSLLGAALFWLGLNNTILRMFVYFLYSNYALVIGFIRMIRGKNTVIWESTKR